MKTIAMAVAAALLCSAPALAELTGTQMDITVTHTGPAGDLAGPADFNHTYGGVDMFHNMFFGDMVIASPTIAAGYDNAVLVDFTAFTYTVFSDSMGMIQFDGIDEGVDAASVVLLANGVSIGQNTNASANGFSAQWNPNDLMAADPATDTMVVAWNSAVPAPGALALLGLAAIAPRLRRSRRLQH